MRGLVFGVTGPIGKATANIFSDDYLVLIDRDISRVNRTEKSSLYECDVRDHEKFRSIVSHEAELGYDFAVFNVALTTEFLANHCSDDTFSDFLEVNLVGANAFVETVRPHIKEGGSIVLTSSIYSIIGVWPELYSGTSMITYPGYAASKAGINGLVKYYCAEFGSSNIRLNSLVAGGVFNDQDERFVKRYSARVPFGRMAEPEEIANVIYFLSSPKSGYIHGQQIIVDGGLSSV